MSLQVKLSQAEVCPIAGWLLGREVVNTWLWRGAEAMERSAVRSLLCPGGVGAAPVGAGLRAVGEQENHTALILPLPRRPHRISLY